MTSVWFSNNSSSGIIILGESHFSDFWSLYLPSNSQRPHLPHAYGLSLLPCPRSTHLAENVNETVKVLIKISMGRWSNALKKHKKRLVDQNIIESRRRTLTEQWRKSSKMSERARWKGTVEFTQGRHWSWRVPKNPKDDFFIPNLVHFLIQIILRGEMSHYHISKTAPT